MRYFAAIERAYTRALRADPGYAGLVHHNPFAPCYDTLSGRDEPYSLSGLAAFVELPRLVRRSIDNVRTDGRNIEEFDRLRFWCYAQIGEYRCGPRETWDEVVNARALAIATEVRAAHPQASHPYTDSEALDTAKSVAGWVWSRYVGGSLTRVRADLPVRREKQRQRDLAARREAGAVPRDVYLAAVQHRRAEANRLRGLGVTIAEIARRLSAGVRSVHRWISEIRCVPSPRALSDFAPSAASDRPPPSVLDRAKSEKNVARNVVENFPETPAEPSAAPADDGEHGVSARSAQQAPSAPTRESALAYIQRRIREIVNRGPDARPP